MLKKTTIFGTEFNRKSDDSHGSMCVNYFRRTLIPMNHIFQQSSTNTKILQQNKKKVTKKSNKYRHFMKQRAVSNLALCDYNAPRLQYGGAIAYQLAD